MLPESCLREEARINKKERVPCQRPGQAQEGNTIMRSANQKKRGPYEITAGARHRKKDDTLRTSAILWIQEEGDPTLASPGERKS